MAAGSKIYGPLDMNTNRITSVVNPSGAQDAATKDYTDDFFNTTTGHDHDGVDSKQVDHGGLANLTDNNDHPQYRIMPALPAPDLLLMDGTSSVPRDVITAANMSVSGTPTTATLLNAIAPKIGDSWYTSFSITSPFVAGAAMSIVIVANTAWADDDGVQHFFFNMNGVSNNSIYLRKRNTAVLDWYVKDATGTTKYRTKTITGLWPAGTHVIVVTLAADNTQQLFLDGSGTGTNVGAGVRESAVADNYFGNLSTGANELEGSMLVAMYGRVLSAGEIADLSVISLWDNLPWPVVGTYYLDDDNNRLYVYTSAGWKYSSLT